MFSLEMAIVLTELTKARAVEDKPRVEDCSVESYRAARSGLLALTSGLAIIGLLVLGLDVYTARSPHPGTDQLASRLSMQTNGTMEQDE
jgi:hypothetical protein